MKKLFAVAIMLVFILFQLSAQKSNDVLYLKNGSIIKGSLLEVIDNQYKFKTSDGSVFIYSTSEVEKFSNEAFKFEGRKESGVGFVLEAGFLVGAQNTEFDAPFSFNILGDVTINTKEIIGLGSGVEFVGQPFMPLFIEYKHLFSGRKSTPFIFARGGKLFHLNGEDQTSDFYYQQYNDRISYSGGPSFTLGSGISWAKEDHETYLSFAYRNLHTSYKQKNYNSQIETFKNAYNRLEIKFGFRF
jgi:hypothetical protein